MSTFLTQKGNLGLKKLTRDQIVEILPPPITNETLASDLGGIPLICFYSLYCDTPLSFAL